MNEFHICNTDRYYHNSRYIPVHPISGIHLNEGRLYICYSSCTPLSLHVINTTLKFGDFILATSIYNIDGNQLKDFHFFAFHHLLIC